MGSQRRYLVMWGVCYNFSNAGLELGKQKGKFQGEKNMGVDYFLQPGIFEGTFRKI